VPTDKFNPGHHFHKITRLFNDLDSRPKTTTGKFFPKAKAKQLTPEAKTKAKDTTLWP